MKSNIPYSHDKTSVELKRIPKHHVSSFAMNIDVIAFILKCCIEIPQTLWPFEGFL